MLLLFTCGENFVIGTDKLAKILHPSKLLDTMFRLIWKNRTRSQKIGYPGLSWNT